MEQLTPELERRLQVEELWARRNVLADSMNAMRRERFQIQYSLLTRFGTSQAIMPSPDGPRCHPPQATVHVEIMSEPPPGRRLPWMSGIAVVVAAGLLLNADLPYADLMARARDGIGHYLPYLKPPHRPAGHTAGRVPADMRMEVASGIAAAMGSRPHGPTVLRVLQSDSRIFGTPGH